VVRTWSRILQRGGLVEGHRIDILVTKDYHPFMTEEKNQRVALHVTKEAKDSTFVDCDIIGGARIEGRGTLMLRTRIIQFSKEHPVYWWSGLVIVIGFLADLISVVSTGAHFWQWFVR